MRKIGKTYIGIGILILLFFVIIIFWEKNTLKFDGGGKVNQSNSLPLDEGPNHNRLILEKSPYLLQHADNPVDWYPWTEEAFLKAKKEDKPIFLSIGYSACHWCQVMERESFEDEEVAQLLNEHFVAIKVDREERPDIDNLYMAVCQWMTGSGGWPLTIILTADKKPIFSGTYFPKQTKFGRPGLMQILPDIASLWKSNRAQVLEAGNKITQTIQQLSSSSLAGELTEKELERACLQFQESFDEEYGGFGTAPKFPSAHNLSFLLRYWKRSGEKKALEMVEKTLEAMWRGGMYDHVGFGFHRYSTDPKWLVPHFEKMLYDQAMLAMAYIEAYQATGNEQYAEVAQQIFTYVLRDMTSPEGGFFSSENADSEGEEGKFYVWTKEEIRAALGEERGDLFCKVYGVTEEGNFEEARNILYLKKSLEELAADEGLAPENLKRILEQARLKLFKSREKRIHPSKDDKILTDWNGLMISALAKGSQALNKPEYAVAASRAADLLLEKLRRQDGRLLHRYREGEAAILGNLDDYAFLVRGLLELYEATFVPDYLLKALALTGDMLEFFWDQKEGGFYFTGSDSEKLITRLKEVYDGAIPSGNSVAALNLLRLGQMTMRAELEEKAESLLRSFGKTVSQSPMGFSQFLIALDFALGPSREIVIAGNLHEAETERMLEAIWSRFLPKKVLILHPQGKDGEAIEQIIPYIGGQNKIGGKTTAYFCESYACKSPVTDVEGMIALLEPDYENTWNRSQ